jgi:CheY-like chemotaxis protein
VTSFVIALVEDQVQGQQVKLCLEARGHIVSIASSFACATKLLASQKCDLIVSDVHLKNGGSVFDFLKEVKDDLRLKATPFVLISIEPTETARYIGHGLKIASQVIGAAQYLTFDKFDDSALYAEFSKFLEKKRPTKPVLVSRH